MVSTVVTLVSHSSISSEDPEFEVARFRERLSDIRHDLKTPVGHIMGYSEMIEEEVEEELPELLSSEESFVAKI